MIAVDTNVLVRLLTNDDPSEAKRALRLMESDDILIPKTVLLETEWVLRHGYVIAREVISQAFQSLLGLANVEPEDSKAVTQALAWYEDGLDFADALHLASSPKADRFATFDRDFVKKASKLDSIEVFKP
jgi:predicted nucleic-acid-binding protein